MSPGCNGAVAEAAGVQECESVRWGDLVVVLVDAWFDVHSCSTAA